MLRSYGVVRAATLLFDFCQFFANGLANTAILEEGLHHRWFAECGRCTGIARFAEAGKIFYNRGGKSDIVMLVK